MKLKPFVLSLSKGMGFDKLSPNGTFKNTRTDSIIPSCPGMTSLRQAVLQPTIYATVKAIFLPALSGLPADRLLT